MPPPHPIRCDVCSDFLKGKCASYEEYNLYYHGPWHIRDASGVIPGDPIKSYAEYEGFVAGHLDSPYLFCVMLSCEYLWNWIANQLLPTASPDGAYQMANMLENYRTQTDEKQAKEIFRTAMRHELEVFSTATELKNNALWLRKNTL